MDEALERFRFNLRHVLPGLSQEQLRVLVDEFIDELISRGVALVGLRAELQARVERAARWREGLVLHSPYDALP